MRPAAPAVIAAALAGIAAILPGGVRAEPLPSSVAAMIDAAGASGNAATLKTVADLAKKTNPSSKSEIDAQVAALTVKADKVRAEKLAHQSLWQGLKGEGQIGFSNTTGSSQTIGVTASVKLSTRTLHWKHEIEVAADYQKEDGAVSEDEFRVGYEADYLVSRRVYALGTLGWERDPSFGYSGRETASLGLGLKVIDRPKISLALGAGPATRTTAYVAVPEAPAYSQTQVAAREFVTFSWKLRPNITFTEDATGFLQEGGNTLRLASAFTTKLGTALSARVSYVAHLESKPPPGIKNLDTTGRLTLVYGF